MKEFLANKFRILIYGHKASSESYIKWLKKKGVRIGENTKIYSPWKVMIDIQRPWMIEIGNNVHITSGVTILQHGYDWAVIQKKFGTVLGSAGKVKIGNNVFIGTQTTILKGVTIGDNVIIGANSLVNKNLESNGVYAGNPIKLIMSLDEYYEKRQKSQYNEAKQVMIEYYKVYKKIPNKEIFREFFWIFENRNAELCKAFEEVNCLENNYKYSSEIFKMTKPLFNGFDEFIESCDLENIQ